MDPRDPELLKQLLPTDYESTMDLLKFYSMLIKQAGPDSSLGKSSMAITSHLRYRYILYSPTIIEPQDYEFYLYYESRFSQFCIEGSEDLIKSRLPHANNSEECALEDLIEDTAAVDYAPESTEDPCEEIIQECQPRSYSDNVTSSTSDEVECCSATGVDEVECCSAVSVELEQLSAEDANALSRADCVESYSVGLASDGRETSPCGDSGETELKSEFEAQCGMRTYHLAPQSWSNQWDKILDWFRQNPIWKESLDQLLEQNFSRAEWVGTIRFPQVWTKLQLLASFGHDWCTYGEMCTLYANTQHLLRLEEAAFRAFGSRPPDPCMQSEVIWKENHKTPH